MPNHNSKTVLTLLKTAPIAIGAQMLRAGTIVLFFDEASGFFYISHPVKYACLATTITAVSYARFFTRTAKIWNKFSPKEAHDDQTDQNTAESIMLQRLGNAVYAIGGIRAFFLAINAYASSYALLELCTAKNGPVIWSIGAYAVITNFINFLIYNVGIMHEKSIELYKKRDKIRCNTISWGAARTAFIACFGVVALSFYSYFMTKSTLRFTGFTNHTPSVLTEVISVFSGLFSFVTTILSKGLTLHSALSKNPLTILNNVAPQHRYLIPSHVTMGLIHTLSMGFVYYISGMAVFSYIGLNYFSWPAICIQALLAISGAFMEFSFTALKVFDSIVVKPGGVLPASLFHPLLLNDAATPLSAATDIESSTSPVQSTSNLPPTSS